MIFHDLQATDLAQQLELVLEQPQVRALIWVPVILCAYLLGLFCAKSVG